MKIITTQQLIVSNEDIKTLLTRFIEKKTSKKVSSVEITVNGANVTLEQEEKELGEQNV